MLLIRIRPPNYQFKFTPSPHPRRVAPRPLPARFAHRARARAPALVHNPFPIFPLSVRVRVSPDSALTIHPNRAIPPGHKMRLQTQVDPAKQRFRPLARAAACISPRFPLYSPSALLGRAGSSVSQQRPFRPNGFAKKLPRFSIYWIAGLCWRSSVGRAAVL